MAQWIRKNSAMTVHVLHVQHRTYLVWYRPGPIVVEWIAEDDDPLWINNWTGISNDKLCIPSVTLLVSSVSCPCKDLREEDFSLVNSSGRMISGRSADSLQWQKRREQWEKKN